MKTLILTLISTAFAFGKVYEFDQNKDGLTDFRVGYVDGTIKSKEIDYNLDGQFDFVESYNEGEYLYTTKVDSNFDGVFEVEKRASLNGKKITLKTFARVDGKSVQKTEESLDLLLPQSNCVELREQTISFFENFANSFTTVLNYTRDDFTNIDYNLSIHKSCYKNFKSEKFNKYAKNAVTRGLSCLSEIAKKSKSLKGRAEVFNLLDMFKIHFERGENNIEFACNEDSVSWRSANAYGSHSPGPAFGKNQLKHPFVIINPSFRNDWLGNVERNSRDYSDEKFQGVLFHEMIHNMGYRHGVGLDLSYACEGCCFSGEKLEVGEITKSDNLACKLCVGNYKDETDEQYMEDMAKFEAGRESYAFVELIVEKNKSIKWNDRRLSSILEYYFINDDRFGRALAKELLPLIKDSDRKKSWQAKADGVWEGKEGEKLFNESLAKFFKAYVIEGDLSASHKALTKIKYKELVTSKVSSSMSMSSRRVDRSLRTLKDLISEVHPRVDGDFKKDIEWFF